MPKIDSKARYIFLAHSIFWISQKLIQPFLAIFFINELRGVGLAEIGTATLIFYLTAGSIVPVFSNFEEKKKGLKDETLFVIGGYFLRGISFMVFTFSANVLHLYLLYFFLGISYAMYSAADKTVFSNISRKGNKSGILLWGTDDCVVLFSSALGAFLGGYFTNIYGIRIFLMVTGTLTMISGLMYYMVLKKLKRDRIWKGF